MPSSFIVPVATVDAVLTHPNADALEIAHILGWQVVVRKGEYSVGQTVVYFPPDCVLPVEVSDRFGVTKYLSKQRIRCARLRGEPSFGLAVPLDDPSWVVGQNVAEFYGATKYEPPLRPSAGDAETPHPLFIEYTGIENLRNFPDVIREGESVSITEKIHGTNCRVGIIEGEVMAGSHAVRRKRPDDAAMASSTYWFPWTNENVRDLLTEMAKDHRQVILFGEVFGSKVQSLDYGVKGELAFCAFDLLLDGKYVDANTFDSLCERFSISAAPIIEAAVPFSLNLVRQYSSGATTLGADHIREGVVVRPMEERTDPKTGRVILKYLNDAYLLANDVSDFTDA